MQETRDSITRFEKRAILLFSLVASLFVVLLVIQEGIYQYHKHVSFEECRTGGICFSWDDFGHRGPSLPLLLVPLITVALIRPMRFLLSFGLTALLAILFVSGVLFRLDYAQHQADFVRPWSYALSIEDCVFGFFILVMLGWQLSILWRLRKRTSPDD